MLGSVRTAVKYTVRPFVPRWAVRRARTVGEDVRLWPLQLAWNSASGPDYLGRSELEALQPKYPFRRAYRYDADSVLQRGAERADELLGGAGGRDAQTFLEIACSDGMVSALLRRAGRSATAVDLSAREFDSRARDAGVRLLEMDASDLRFDDETFDYAFSYNSFEHFQQPARVLDEMIRVLRPGGHLYLSFGPLYDSPWGEHAYRTITVPYCQFLFPLELMNEYAADHGLGRIRPDHVNRWPTSRYRTLWKEAEDRLERLHYLEHRDLSCLDLLKTYPSCFRKRSPRVTAFVVSQITVLFRKRRIR